MKKNRFVTSICVLSFAISLISFTGVSARTVKYQTSTVKKSSTYASLDYTSLTVKGKSKVAKAVNRDMKKRNKALRKYYKGMKKTYGTGEYGTGSFCSSDKKVSSRKGKYFSIQEYNMEYSAGGAHPFSNFVGYNYNIKTGKRVYLTDVLNLDLDTTKKKIQTKLTKYFKKHNIESSIYDETTFKDYKEDTFQFYIKGKKVHVVFSPYDVAPYAVGFVEITFKLK
ncbi:MAG: RsiV family protein [Eubacterium sp.]|nr:RsiV family protein [Eubacterium sp.]